MHYYVPGTSMEIILLSSLAIAIIAFFLKPRISMLLILIFIYTLPRAGFVISTAWYYYPIPIGYIFITFMMVKWTLLKFIGGTGPKKENPISHVFTWYVVVAISAIIIGIVNRGKISVMLLEIVFYFLAFFTYFMVLDVFSSEKCVRLFMRGILICGFLVTLYGILLLVFGKSLLINGVTYNSSSYITLIGQFIIAKRTISSYGDPNALSAQLMVFCGIFGSLVFLGDFKIVKRTFLTIGLILTIICIYFASSRASLLGVFILFIVFAITRIKKVLLWFPLITAAYIMFLEPIRQYHNHRLFTTGIPSTDLRIMYVKKFFELLTKVPFGAGFGNGITEDYIVVPAYNIWYGFNSFYLNIFSRVGIQGLIVFTIMLFLMVKYIFAGLRYITNPNVRYFAFGAACGIVVQQFNFLANNVYHVPGGMLNFWVMCGMLTAIVNLYKKSPR